MPTTRRRRARHRIEVEVSRERRHLLRTGRSPDWPNANHLDLIQLMAGVHRGGGLLAELWTRVGETLLAEWIQEHASSRPRAWWRFDAPECTALPVFAPDGEWLRQQRIPEPRRRLGGTRQPIYECSNTAIRLPFGRPVDFVRESWVDEDDDRVPFDPKDPPRYESQAAYLERHGLLVTGERRRLRAADFEVEIVAADDGRDLRW